MEKKYENEIIAGLVTTVKKGTKTTLQNKRLLAGVLLAITLATTACNTKDTAEVNKIEITNDENTNNNTIESKETIEKMQSFIDYLKSLLVKDENENKYYIPEENLDLANIISQLKEIHETTTSIHLANQLQSYLGSLEFALSNSQMPFEFIYSVELYEPMLELMKCKKLSQEEIIEEIKNVKSELEKIYNQEKPILEETTTEIIEDLQELAKQYNSETAERIELEEAIKSLQEDKEFEVYCSINFEQHMNSTVFDETTKSKLEKILEKRQQQQENSKNRVDDEAYALGQKLETIYLQLDGETYHKIYYISEYLSRESVIDHKYGCRFPYRGFPSDKCIDELEKILNKMSGKEESKSAPKFESSNTLESQELINMFQNYLNMVKPLPRIENLRSFNKILSDEYKEIIELVTNPNIKKVLQNMYDGIGSASDPGVHDSSVSFAEEVVLAQMKQEPLTEQEVITQFEELELEMEAIYNNDSETKEECKKLAKDIIDIFKTDLTLEQLQSIKYYNNSLEKELVSLELNIEDFEYDIFNIKHKRFLFDSDILCELSPESRARVSDNLRKIKKIEIENQYEKKNIKEKIMLLSVYTDSEMAEILFEDAYGLDLLQEKHIQDIKIAKTRIDNSLTKQITNESRAEWEETTTLITQIVNNINEGQSVYLNDFKTLSAKLEEINKKASEESKPYIEEIIEYLKGIEISKKYDINKLNTIKVMLEELSQGKIPTEQLTETEQDKWEETTTLITQIVNNINEGHPVYLNDFKTLSVKLEEINKKASEESKPYIEEIIEYLKGIEISKKYDINKLNTIKVMLEELSQGKVPTEQLTADILAQTQITTNKSNINQNSYSKTNTQQEISGDYVNIVNVPAGTTLYKNNNNVYLETNLKMIYLGGVYQDTNGNLHYLSISSPYPVKEIADELVNQGWIPVSINLVSESEFNKVYKGNVLTDEEIRELNSIWIPGNIQEPVKKKVVML